VCRVMERIWKGTVAGMAVARQGMRESGGGFTSRGNF